MTTTTRSRTRSAVASAVVLAVALIVASGYMLTRQQQSALTMRELLPIDVLGTLAIIEGEVTSAAALDGSEQVLTVENVSVRWRADEARLADGSLHPVPPIDADGEVTVRAWSHHNYQLGERYHLFLISSFHAAPDPSPWRAQLALQAEDQSPVEGVDEGTVRQMRALLTANERPATHTVRAMHEFTIEQYRALQARNAGQQPPPPGPRTARLEAARQSDRAEPLEQWLATPPDRRILGMHVAEVPEGAAEALGVRWVESLMLVAHDADDAARFKRLTVVSPHGYSTPTALNAERGATLIPFVRAHGAWLTIAAQPDGTDTREDVTGRADRELTRVIDRGGGLFLDLRNGRTRVEAMAKEQFDERVLDLRP